MPINQSFYSRQIATYGIEAMKKLVRLKILVIGIRGIGLEIAKNLILAGPACIGIYDPTIPSIEEMGVNFFLRPEHIGKLSRAAAVTSQLKELNPYVQVDDESHKDLISIIEGYNVVVVAELIIKPSKIIEINNRCRAHTQAIGFILALSSGLAGHIFVDFGDKFTVIDSDGKDVKSYMVTQVTNNNPGRVFISNNQRHEFKSGDQVKFSDVDGMSELNKLAPMPIHRDNDFTFSICDTTNFRNYTKGGIVELVKPQINMGFKSLEECFKHPLEKNEFFIEMEIRQSGIIPQLHLALRALFRFFEEIDCFPRLNNEEDALKFVAIAKDINEKSKAASEFNLDIINEALLKKYSYGAKAQLITQTSFYGAIAAQETVKFTGLYTPLKQLFHNECFESLPKVVVNTNVEGKRYDDYISIYGRETVQKWRKAKIFMVGAGALGCEYVKAFALMGISTEGSLLVTDMDTIKLPNLSNHLLYKMNNIGQFKAECAINAAHIINDEVNYQFAIKKLCPDAEEVFNGEFWDKLDLVIGAVDSKRSRQYIDQRCVCFQKPYLDSSALGTMCQSNILIPKMTQCYSDGEDLPEIEFDLSTLKNFPNIIDHCIEWGKNKFEQEFTTYPIGLINYLENSKECIADLKRLNHDLRLLEILKGFLGIASLIGNNFEKCVEKAILAFTIYFTHEIKNLLHYFPADLKIEDGTLFWSRAIGTPSPVELNLKNEFHSNFIKSYSILSAKLVGIKIPSNFEEVISNVVNSYKIAEFDPQQYNLSEKQILKNSAIITHLLDKSIISIKPYQIFPESFEFDDDQNYHVELINSFANIRAANYKIKQCDFEKTKRIAGKIIPAITTSTALIVGSSLNEAIKLLQGFNEIEDYKNCFVNLAIPMFIIQEPTPPKQMKSKAFDIIMSSPVKAIPEGHTIWERILLKAPMTVQQISDMFAKEYQSALAVLSYRDCIIYNSYLPSANHRMSQTPEAIIEELTKIKLVSNIKHIIFEASLSWIPDSNISVQVPAIQYLMK